MDPYISIFIISSLVLILISGVFSLFDSALGSCRKSRLEKEQGKRYKAVLETLENPRMLSLACHLWINILKVLAIVLATFTFFLSLNLDTNISPWFFVVVFAVLFGIVIAILSVALPGLLSRSRPEKIAAVLLPAMKALSIPMMPFTVPVMKAASLLKKILRLEIDDNNITEEELQDELRNTLMEGEKSGIVESKERTMVEGVFYLGDRPVGAFMTHRSEVQWLDVNAPYEEIKTKALEFRHQRCFPVVNKSPDEIVGTVYPEDIILDMAQQNPQGLRAIMKKAQFVPETMSALKAFESFREGQANFLFVMDEYGGLAGIISIRALVEEIVGELSPPVQKEEPLVRQEDGTMLADGTLNIDDAAKALSLAGLGETGDFHTLAGFILSIAGELPSVGDSFKYQGYVFKVLEMDGNRIDKLLITEVEQD